MGKKKSSTNSSKTSTNENTNVDDNNVVPDEFKKVIFDFIIDIINTFPEYSNDLMNNYIVLNTSSDSDNDNSKYLITETNLQDLYSYCKKVYPERFFDILYKNEDIFKVTTTDCDKSTECENSNENKIQNDTNTNFLPTIDFKLLWNTDISDNTKEAIWKYLQLILFSIITNIKDRNSFGDTAKLFEAINEEELKNKLQETFVNMNKLFDDQGNLNLFDKDGNIDFEMLNPEDFGFDLSGVEIPNFSQSDDFSHSDDIHNKNSDFPKGFSKNFPKGFPKGFESMFKRAADAASSGNDSNELPNPETVHEHLSKLLNGKIGSLAKELVEESAADFDFNFEDSGDGKMNMNNVFQKMFKNPGKLMNLVKNVGKKIDDKFKSGDIKESELLQEASDLLSQMKGMPGMNNLSNLFSQMGMGDMGNLASMMSAMGGGKGKMNIGAMQSHLQQNMKQAKMKERMHQKLEQKKQNNVSQTVSQSAGLKNNTLQGEIEQSKLMMQQLQQTEQQLLLSELEIDNIQNSILSSNKNNNNKKKKSKK